VDGSAVHAVMVDGADFAPDERDANHRLTTPISHRINVMPTIAAWTAKPSTLRKRGQYRPRRGSFIPNGSSALLS